MTSWIRVDINVVLISWYLCTGSLMISVHIYLYIPVVLFNHFTYCLKDTISAVNGSKSQIVLIRVCFQDILSLAFSIEWLILLSTITYLFSIFVFQVHLDIYTTCHDSQSADQSKSTMRFRIRRVCLFLVLATLVLVAFFHYSLDSLPSSHGAKRPLHLGPRYNEFKPRVNADADYISDVNEDDGVMDMKRGPVPVDNPSESKGFDLMALAMVNSPEDQKIRDEGKRKLPCWNGYVPRVPSQYKDHLFRYGDSHVKDKTEMRPSCL